MTDQKILRPSPPRRGLVLFIAVFVFGLCWALYTQHAWEDYYITYRAAKNLATGHGLTFTVGERVHSFTSPLGVLLPALSSLLTGNSSDDAALWIFRLLSLSAYAGAGIILWSVVRRLYGPGLAAGLMIALFAIDTKIVDYSTNGQETGFLLLFLSWALYAIIASPARQSLHLGLAWAGLMWTRPDSCVYIAALGVGAWMFAPFEGAGGRIGFLKNALLAAIIAALLYLPWVCWAWNYYGTPVPHTVTAKGLFHDPVTMSGMLKAAWDFPKAITLRADMLATTYMPPYSANTGWPVLFIKSTYWIALICMAVWVVPGIRRATRLASFVFCAGEFYLTTFVGFPVPWYIPACTLFSLVVICGLIGQASEHFRAPSQSGPAGPGRRILRLAVGAMALFFVAGSLAITLLAAHQLRLQQRIIERGEREVIGLWLRDHAESPRDSVFLEPLGYIGFYSQLKMLDYPGLCAPEVVAVRKRFDARNYPDCWSVLITELAPTWLVLRDYEADAIRHQRPELLSEFYALVKIFDVKPQVNAIPFIMGRGYLLNDAYFEVYHRKNLPKQASGKLVGEMKLISAPMFEVNKSWSGRAYDDSDSHLVANAPSELIIRKPRGVKWISGRFGIFPGAYEHPRDATDGADFYVYMSATAASGRHELFHRFLNPRDVAGDRGLQTFSVELPVSATGMIEFVITPGPKGNDAYDWTYWSNLLFEYPRQARP